MWLLVHNLALHGDGDDEGSEQSMLLLQRLVALVSRCLEDCRGQLDALAAGRSKVLVTGAMHDPAADSATGAAAAALLEDSTDIVLTCVGSIRPRDPGRSVGCLCQGLMSRVALLEPIAPFACELGTMCQ